MPRLRVDRAEIAAAHSWVAPALRSQAKGARASAAWDEDAVTMAVSAARDGLGEIDRGSIGSLHLGSTTAPYADRLNSGIVATALGLSDGVGAYDLAGSLRAGTSALLGAFDAAVAHGKTALAIGSDRRKAPPASLSELTFGHGAAAIAVGPGHGFARLVGRRSLTVDFVDHFRAVGRDFDYGWEERWVRDEGYMKLVPQLIGALLADVGVAVGDITHFCMPAPFRRLDTALGKGLGLADDALADQLADGCGNTGAAHPLLMLVHTLEQSKPGDMILVLGFGQGGDALLFEVTDAIAEHHGGGVSKWVAAGVECSYPRYLALNDILPLDRGMRAELDRGSALTAAWRHRDLTLGLTGGRCTRCGTYQIPRAAICVECRAADSQEPHSFADSQGTIASWSADSLVYTPDPPAYYGMVDFAEGGRLLMDFTDIHGEIDVGTAVGMVFRVKDHDVTRGFARYFWKAAPLTAKEA